MIAKLFVEKMQQNGKKVNVYFSIYFDQYCNITIARHLKFKWILYLAVPTKEKMIIP